jgi:hypothetical protein
MISMMFPKNLLVEEIEDHEDGSRIQSIQLKWSLNYTFHVAFQGFWNIESNGSSSLCCLEMQFLKSILGFLDLEELSLSFILSFHSAVQFQDHFVSSLRRDSRQIEIYGSEGWC